MKNKLIALFTSLIIAFMPLLSVAGTTYTGSRGGTYTFSPSGNKEYTGHNSDYGHSGDSSSGDSGMSPVIIIVMVIGILIFVAFLALCIGAARSNRPAFIDDEKNYKKNKAEEEKRKERIKVEGEDFKGIKKFPKSPNELIPYNVWIIGKINGYEKHEVNKILNRYGITTNQNKKINYWFLGKVGVDEGNLSDISFGDRVSTEEYLIPILKSIESGEAQEKRAPTISPKTHPHLYVSKAREDMLNKQSERKIYLRNCAECSRGFKTLLERRVLCKTCR